MNNEINLFLCFIPATSAVTYRHPLQAAHDQRVIDSDGPSTWTSDEYDSPGHWTPASRLAYTNNDKRARSPTPKRILTPSSHGEWASLGKPHFVKTGITRVTLKRQEARDTVSRRC